MTHDEVHAHLDGLPAAEGWAWLYSQSPEVQELALRNMVAISARNAGHEPDAAWAIALQRVPMDREYPMFRGVDSDREWADLLVAVSDDGDGCDQVVSVFGDVAHTLVAGGADASEDGTGRGTPIITVSGANLGVGSPGLVSHHLWIVATQTPRRPTGTWRLPK